MTPETLTPYFETIFGVGFTLWGAVCMLALISGLPGTWILIGTAMIVDLVDRLWLPSGAPLTFHPLTLAVCALIGAAVGTAAGAVIGELSTRDKTLAETAKPALGAVIGRVLGTLAKLPLGLVVWVTLAIAAFA